MPLVEVGAWVWVRVPVGSRVRSFLGLLKTLRYFCMAAVLTARVALVQQPRYTLPGAQAPTLGVEEHHARGFQLRQENDFVGAIKVVSPCKWRTCARTRPTYGCGRSLYEYIKTYAWIYTCIHKHILTHIFARSHHHHSIRCLQEYGRAIQLDPAHFKSLLNRG